MSQAEKQRDLWKGWQQEELVVCIGTDKSASQVKWASTFSWCDDTSMEVYLKQYLAECDSLNLVDLGAKVVDGLQSGKWHRKNFEDFKYIKVEMTEGAIHLVFHNHCIAEHWSVCVCCIE